MSKINLTYTLPEEAELANVALHATDLFITIWDLDQWLRAEYKHAERGTIPIDEMRDKIRELLAEHGCNIDMLS